MNYDKLTREQAVDLLRLAMETLAALDTNSEAEQRRVVVSARPLDYNSEPAPSPIVRDEWGGAYQRTIDDVTFLMAANQARRTVRQVQYTVWHRAEKLGVLKPADSSGDAP